MSPEPYLLRGEEGGTGRYMKWSERCRTATISGEEEEALSEYFFQKFVKCGVEMCDRAVTPDHYPHDTCPGLPYTQYGIKTKGDVAAAYSHPELIKAGMENILRKEVPIYEFAKCEPIKRTKDVRTITCYPMHVHVALISKLLAFSEATKTFKQCKIGWSKWRLGVQDLCNSTSGKTYCFEADARRFDSTLPTCLIRLVLETYFCCWPAGTITIDEIDALVGAVTEGLVFSSNGEVYWKVGGNASGNPVTTEINTAVHLALWALAWYRKFGTLDGFDNEDLLLYGDDVFGATNGALLPAELPELLKDMPVEYPIESIKISNNPSGLTFLGCTFYRKNDFWLWRPAKPQKMLATLVYSEKGDTTYDLALELSRVRGILLDCAWDQEMWNLLYPYQLALETMGANEGVVGRHVDRAFVQWLTLGLN